MKEITIEIEVDAPSRIVNLPVSEDNIIELDFTHLDDDWEDIEDSNLETQTDEPHQSGEDQVDEDDPDHDTDQDAFDNDLDFNG